MKKQLLTALLAFTPFFATTKPSNAELLAHLKNVKADIKNQLQEISEEEKEVKAELGLQEYTKLINQWNIFFDTKAKEFEKIELETYLDLIYTQMKSIDEAQNVACKYFSNETNVKLTNLENEIFKLIDHYEITVGSIAAINFFACYWITDSRRFFNSLLEQIETKIKELEIQN